MIVRIASVVLRQDQLKTQIYLPEAVFVLFRCREDYLPILPIGGSMKAPKSRDTNKYFRFLHTTKRGSQAKKQYQSIFMEMALRKSGILFLLPLWVCQDNQKRDPLTTFQNLTTQPPNSIPQIIIHPKTMQLMEGLAFFLS